MENFVVGLHDLQLEPRNLSDQLREGFKPRKDIAPWPLTFPIDWGADPFKDRNWQFHLNAWRMLDPIISDYLKRGDVKTLRSAMPFIIDWHRFHIVEKRDSKFSWYDMSVGQRSAKLAFVVEHVKRGVLVVSEDERAKLGELVDAHIAELMRPEKIAPNNHGLFQALGLKLLGTVMGDRAPAEEFAVAKFREIMDAQFTPEGVHTENSPGYHFYTQNTLLRSRVSRHFGDPFFGKGDLIKAVNPWLVFPNRVLARVGDSDSESNPLSEDPDTVAKCDDRSYAVGDFTRSGYAVVRSVPSQTQDSMLFVTGMAHSEDHKHSDELSFELFERGRFIFVDTGKYGYKNSPMRNYAISADAHNTIGLVGRQIAPADIELSGSLLKPIEQVKKGFRIEGFLRRPRLFQQHRTIAYRPGRSITITDRVMSQETREFVSSLHLAPDLSPTMRRDGFDVKAGNLLIRARVRGAARVETARGQKEPLLGWHCVGYLEMTPTNAIRAVTSSRMYAQVRWTVKFYDLSRPWFLRLIPWR